MAKKGDKETDLESIYTGVGKAGSYTSAAQLYKEAKRRGLDVTRRDVLEFASQYRSESMFRKGRRADIAIFAVALNQKWQLDLAFYPPYRGFIGFLVCIDVLSRKCHVGLLKNKTASHVARALEAIVEETGETPSYVVTDRGREFIGTEFRQLLSRLAIIHYFANPPHKAALAERVIGSLKQAEGRLTAAFPGRNWPERIERACRAYNDTVHSATGLAPSQVTTGNANRVFRKLYKPFAGVWDLDKRAILGVGTGVRLRLTSRGTFAKGNAPRNTSEVYTVGRIRLHPRAGVKYKLLSAEGGVPIAGTYERGELVPVKEPQL